MWGQVKDAPALEWPDVERRIEQCPEYWMVAARPDQAPAARPVWGVWLDERFLLSVGSTSLWKGVAHDPRVAIHLPDPLGVVIVEGTARKASGDEAFWRRFVDVYNPKYAWSFDPASPMVVDGTIEVRPSAVLAWTTVPVSESGPDMSFPSAAGRWMFD